MADFTLGLAKTAVEGTLSRVQSAIDEETKLKAAAQQDLVFITGEFQMMQSFLKVATKERAGNEVVKTWVRQLRDLAFDVEDCVEFVIHLDNESAMSWVWRLVPSCMAPPRSRDLDLAVAELKMLKARVEEVSQRNTRYNLISDSGSNPVSQPPTEQLATTGPSTIDILMELWEANGRHHGFCNLQKLITNEGNDLQVISLWGSAGSDIERTQIINKAYCDPEICDRFKSRAWVKLMHPFNPEEFLKNLQTRLQASSWSCQAVDFKGKISEDDSMKQLAEQRYLIILEGIPSVVEWEIIRMYLPDNNNGSRIVVSTKQISDAMFLTGEPYRVSVLSEFTGGHYLCAFYKKGSGRSNVMGDLIWLLGRRPGVISVWGTGVDKLTLVKELFDFIQYRDEKIVNSQGAGGILYGWVDVAYPFFWKDFYLSLSQSFHKNDNSYMDMEYWFDWFLRQKHNHHCLVVINGLQSTKEWELIERKLASEDIKGHIIVITNDESVGTSCVNDDYRALNVNDVALHPSMQIHDYMDELFWRLRHHRVISVCGPEGDTSALLKQVYDGIKHQHVGFKKVPKFEHYVWVDLTHPFDEKEFFRCWFKGLFPDVDGSEGTDEDQFRMRLFTVMSSHVYGYTYEDEGLAERLAKRACEEKCMYIINGLQSMEEWELIKPFLVGGKDGYSCIILFANEGVPNHFEEHLEANTAVIPFSKASDYYGYGDSRKASQSIFLDNIMIQNHRAWVDNLLPEILHGTGVTSVWGIAGVGKSALVRGELECRYQSPEGSGHERFAWVDIPAGPFDLVKFSRLMFLDFHRGDHDAMEAAAIGIMQGQDPIQGCREILRQRQCHVIIDGLRSTNDWDLIETAFLSQPTRKVKIVVITTEESVAKHSVKQHADQMINIKCLEDDKANDLFKMIIGPKELDSLKGKVDLAKLVAKCGGLPKVVSAIANAPGSFLEHMSDDFMVKLETDPQFHSLSGLLSWMHSYFDACSDSIKPCIFYLSVFSSSSIIRRGRLVRRWIAEGYSRDAPGCTARENARKRLSELVKLSIIQQATSKVICQVNGFFREYIISRPMDDNLVFALDGHCGRNTQHTGKHLSIMADWHRNQNVFESIDFARLRSLTIFGEWCSFFISDKMKRLRVLDLEDVMAVTNDDIKKICVNLLSLKFISLRGCRKISRLPDTLGGLRQLQTLDVRFTSIVMLPSAIIKLQKLQYIRAGTIVLPDEDWTSASSEDADGVTSQLPPATSTELEGRDSSIPAGRPIAPTSPENDIAERPAQLATSPELVDCGSNIFSGQSTVPASPENGIAESPEQAATPELEDRHSSISARQPSPENGIAESPAQATTSPEAQDRYPKLGWASKLSCTSLVPRLPKFPSCTWSLSGSEREKEAQQHSAGVEIPAGIEKLAALHTVGVVNVNASGGEAFLKQLAKLTQLLKLRVCGINKKNWQSLCTAISDHGHLESLSVRFDEDCLNHSFKPPMTLTSLKLYGPIRKLPDTIKLLVNLKKLDLEMTIAGPDGMLLFLKDKLPRNDILNRLCINVQGHHNVDSSMGEWDYSEEHNRCTPQVVKIDCSTNLEVTLKRGDIFSDVEVLIIQCSKGSSFRISRHWRYHLYNLKTVWLKGSYSEEERQNVKELVDDHQTAVLKLEPL